MKFNHLDENKFVWECYRSPTSHLVYFAHRKCATCTYIALLTQLNWYPCKSTDIIWDNDLVFAHIKNPLVKHRKGIVEVVAAFDLIDLVMQQPDLQRLLVTADRFDVHTCTIQRFFGHNALKVKWIPIDTDLDHKKETVDLIETYDPPIAEHVKQDFFSNPEANKNPSSPQEVALYEKLSALPVTPLNAYYLDFDQCLYDYVTKKNFEPPNYDLRILQLKNLGHDQISAEHIADDEVANQEFLNWKF